MVFFTVTLPEDFWSLLFPLFFFELLHLPPMGKVAFRLSEIFKNRHRRYNFCVCVCVCCGPNLPIVCFQISPLSMSIVTESQLAKNLFALGRKKKPLYCMWKRQR